MRRGRKADIFWVLRRILSVQSISEKDRLIEPMSAGGTFIPAHTILTGLARTGDRLDVTITSIEYQGRIYATDISAYDVNGQRGIATPPPLEANAM